MDALLQNLAESSPVAVVAIFALWRISVVMVVLADGLVRVVEASEARLSEKINSTTPYGGSKHLEQPQK